MVNKHLYLGSLKKDLLKLQIKIKIIKKIQNEECVLLPKEIQ